jgi:hypothetical protein
MDDGSHPIQIQGSVSEFFSFTAFNFWALLSILPYSLSAFSLVGQHLGKKYYSQWFFCHLFAFPILFQLFSVLLFKLP